MFVRRCAPPDDPPIAGYLAYAVQRYAVQCAFIVVQFEREARAGRKSDCRERYDQDAILAPVVIADFKMTRAEARVPADAIEQLVDGQHGMVHVAGGVFRPLYPG
jgi:hypothetical protein